MIFFWNYLFDGWLTDTSKTNKKNEEEKIKKEKFVASRLVPDNWKNLPAQKMIGLAQDLTGEKYKSKAAAQRAIQKVLNR